jgi:hypothetical protein
VKRLKHTCATSSSSGVTRMPSPALAGQQAYASEEHLNGT